MILKERNQKTNGGSMTANNIHNNCSECVSSICHEIRNPLAIISGYIQVNKKNLSEKDYKTLNNSINRISKFTKGLHNEKDMAQYGKADKTSEN